MAKRELLSPSNDTASKAIVSVQAATTRVKAIITECTSKGVSDEELTKRLNKAIAEECKSIKDPAFREQFRKSLVISARKWHYQMAQTYKICDTNLRNAVAKQPLNIELLNLLDKTPYQKQFEFRKILDDGTNPGIPVIKDYQSSVKLAVKALSADPPKIVTTKNGKAYIMPARLRAELAVRYAAAVENLQRLIDEGVLFCWISSHANCSPRCRQYQGKLYSLFQGKATINGREYGESGTIDGIPYRPINEALSGANNDGNGCISGYGCRHRAIEYEKGSKPPEDFSKAEMEREYDIDKQQRAYENRIRQLKQEEKQLRACGMEKEASAKRKQWRRLTKDYQIYSIENDRAYYPYRYVIDRDEKENKELEQTTLTNLGDSGILETKASYIDLWDNDVNKFFEDSEKQWVQSLSAQDKKAVTDYTGASYSRINKELRENINLDRISGTTRLDVGHLDTAIANFDLKENISTYRAITPDVFGETKEDLLKLVGTQFKDNAYLSTSPSMKTFEGGEGYILAKIDVMKGKGNGAYINSLSEYKDVEYEFLLPRGTTCEIYEIAELDGKPLIKMRVIYE